MKVAINGFGRIGRLALRQMLVTTDFDVVAINDLTDAENLAYLFKYDTTHRSFHPELISSENNYLVINKSKKIPVFNEKDPNNLPWKELDVDLVLECTGLFTNEQDAMAHIKSGAKKVLISAPGKGNMKTVVANVNDNILDGSEQIVSAASCTTNCLAPVLDVLEKEFGIEKGFMSTIHAYTNDQATLDIAHKKGYLSRRGRACASNIVPTKTGATAAIKNVLPDLDGKLMGEAYRVPVTDGSVIEVILELKKPVNAEVINLTFKKYVNETLKFTMDPVVSSDIIGEKCGALVDGLLTSVLESNNTTLVKVVAWYDNEMGYTAQMLRTAKKMFER